MRYRPNKSLFASARRTLPRKPMIRLWAWGARKHAIHSSAHAMYAQSVSAQAYLSVLLWLRVTGDRPDSSEILTDSAIPGVSIFGRKVSLVVLCHDEPSAEIRVDQFGRNSGTVHRGEDIALNLVQVECDRHS